MNLNAQQKRKFFKNGVKLLALLLVIFLAAPAQAIVPPVGPQQPPQTLQQGTANTFVAPATCPENNNPSGQSGETCEMPGASMTMTGALITEFQSHLSSSAVTLETWMYEYIPQFLYSEYDQLDWLERSMIDWWNTMWYYNALPSSQQMANQLSVQLALQTHQLHTYADAMEMLDADRTMTRHAVDDRKKYVGDQVCVAATSGGGLTRSTAISYAMRQAWENKSLASGLNSKNDPNGALYPGASQAAGVDQQRYNDWQNIFCDSQGNSVSDVHCGAGVDKNLTNMDVLPVKYLFNNLTINVNDTTAAGNSTEGKNMELGLEYLINNLVGLPAIDAVTPTALSSPGGQEAYLARRSYLARYAAIRSVPDMIAGWRMPGSQMGKWLKDLRQGADLPANAVQDSNLSGNNGTSSLALAGGISSNPSYKEVMHALSVDRFNNSKYAQEMITDPANVDLEKLNVSVLYLMQLRDYYELLERTALTLAVQVSILTDEQTGTGANSAQPISRTAAPAG